MNYELFLGDCLDIMPGLDTNSIDLTVTSPPYDNLRKYGKGFDANKFDWKAIIRELYRVTAVGGVVVWVVADQTIKGSETLTSFRQAIYARDEVGFLQHDTMFYHTNKPPLSHNRYEQCIEYMFVWSKGKPKTTNLIRERCIYHGIDNRRNGHHTHNGGYIEDKRMRSGVKRKGPKPTKIKNNLWYFPTGSGHSGDAAAFAHPATFPEALARNHILSWSNPGEVVLDPLMGSGTTGKEAVKLDRKFIGIELDETYHRLASQRIKNAANDFVMTDAEKSTGQVGMFDVLAE